MKNREFWQNMGLGLAALLVFYGMLYYARTHIETAPLNLTKLNSSTTSPIEKIRTIFTAPVIKNVTLPPIFSNENNDAGTSTIATTTATTTEKTILEATITVGSLTYTLSLPINTTLLEAMKETGTSTTNTTFSFKTENRSNVLTIQEINGQPNFPPLYWTYYVNGVVGSSSISDYKIQDKDVIDWKLQ
ncbi:MAG: DUF4430 domain-containing protein [bacterium]